MKKGDKYYKWKYAIWKDGEYKCMEVGVYGLLEQRDIKVGNLMNNYPESEGYELKYVGTEEFTYGE